MAAVSAANAQGAWDGLLLSQTQYEGTARFTAMGGAFAALGGDFTTLSVNPAGIGVYRNTELTFSLAFNHGNTEAKYLAGNPITDSYVNVGVNNLGIVFGDAHGSDGLVSLNWGVGYNKLHNVTNRRITASGTSGNSSILTVLANELTEAHPPTLSHELDTDNIFDNLSSAYWSHILAWQTGLIDTINQKYITATENASDLSQSGLLKHAYYAEQAGHTGEYVFSLGGNISNRFYFGFTAGMQAIRNEYYKKYSETAVNPSDFDTAENPTKFSDFTYSERLNTSGTGYNVKLGFIWKPAAGLRWGAYFHSPTWMYLTDKFSEQINSHFSDGDRFSSDVSSTSDYKVVTPVKWGTGFAYIFDNYGLISIDYEGTDYSTLKMYGLEDNYYVRWTDVDDEVREEFKVATHIRAGVEYRIKQYALRGGYAYYGSPVKNDDSYARHIISAGAGYQSGGYFIDAVYSASPGNKETLSPYKKETLSLYADNNNLKNTNFAGKFLITLGFRF
ncbi:MAG: hypothetical protein LBT49_04595 [Prevotellaceae bacterium]|nr:hypothetical protein [Prevotellaceae bacterium]